MALQVAKPYNCILINAPKHIQNGQFAALSFTPLRNRLRQLGYHVHRIKACWGPWGFKGVLIIQFGSTLAHAESAFKLQRMFERRAHSRNDYLSPTISIVEPYLWVGTDADAEYLKNTVDYGQVPYATIFDGQHMGDVEPVDAYNEIIAVFQQMYQ